MIWECNFRKQVLCEGVCISLSGNYERWQLVISWKPWRMLRYQEIWRKRHPVPCKGWVISHKLINYNKHFDLEVITFSRFYFLILKMEVSYKSRGKAIQSERPNGAWNARTHKAETCLGNRCHKEVSYETLDLGLNI